MSDQSTLSEELTKLLAAVQATGHAQSTPNPWSTATSNTTPAQVLTIAVPISLDTPAGKVRAYLSFEGSHAASPQALLALLEQLHNAGMPLDTWQPRDSGHTWNTHPGTGWSGNRTPFGRPRGGYNR